MKRRSLEAIFRALNAENVRYLVVEGLAVVVHGYLRATVNVDLVLEPVAEARRRAVRALGSLGYRPRSPVPIEAYADAEEVARWRSEKGLQVFTLWSDLHFETEIGLFVFEPFDFERAHARTRREEIAPDVVMTVVPREELIEMKRLAGRARDRDDLEALEIIGEEGTNPNG